jgi:membrane-bound serine protease (ClpP class)
VRRLPTPGYESQTSAPIGATRPDGGTGPTRPSRGRRLRLLVACSTLLLGAVLGLLGGFGAAASAQTPGTTPGAAPASDTAKKSVVAVVTVNGFIDPVLLNFMQQSINDANKVEATALIFQVDLQGSVIPDGELVALIAQMRASKVPIDLWVGPTGSELAGKAAALTGGARKVAMAPGTSITVWDTTISTSEQAVRVLVPEANPDGAAAFQAKARTLDAKQAEDAKVASFAPTLGDFFVSLPGVETKETQVNGQTRREPVTNVVFSQLGLLDAFFHTISSPAVAYLLLTIGLSLLIFELFTAGVGVAGVLGAGSFVFACYGLAVLPNHWYGIALIVFAMIAFAIDVQTGVPRFWSGAGMVMYVLGALTLYDGVAMSWLTMGVGIVGVALAFFAGMPSMVRTRFSTPTIGREWMIGEMGRATTEVNPDGIVQIRGAQWRAYTNRATPIEQLDAVRVVGIEGLVLEVEPEEGAAKDYRDRSPKGTAADGAKGADAPAAG